MKRDLPEMSCFEASVLVLTVLTGNPEKTGSLGVHFVALLRRWSLTARTLSSVDKASPDKPTV